MKTYTLPESSNACCLVRDDGSLFVQIIDAYRFQREMIVSPTVEGFTVHVYQHPARREIVQTTRAVGAKFLARFLEITEKYPTLLFNAANASEARCAGFVSLQESIFRGQHPSASML